MPESQPSPITADLSGEDWKAPTQEMMKQINFLIKDLYNYIDGIQGYGGRVFTPEAIDPLSIGAHTHTAADQGGDYAWADFIAADVAWLQAVRAVVLATNILSRIANETISGNWVFTNAPELTSATASRLLATSAAKLAVSVADLTSWIAVSSTTRLTVVSDGDGSVTLDTKALLGDGTVGRVVCKQSFTILKGTAANSLKCSMASLWNGDTIGETDDILKDGVTVGNFQLNAAGTVLQILSTGFTGTGVMVFAKIAQNSCAVYYTVSETITGVGNNISLSFYTVAGVVTDITTIVAAGGALFLHIILVRDA